MIKVTNLTKQFERHIVTDEKKKKSTKETFFAVDHISMEVAPGEIVGILGPNGAGKTTLLRMLGSIMEPTEGRVEITLEEGTTAVASAVTGNPQPTATSSDPADPQPTASGALAPDSIPTVAIHQPVELKKHIGYLSGNTKLYHRFSTREMLYMLAEIYGLSKEAATARIQEISAVLDMADFLDNRIEKLSTGQTQRASIARCLIHDPAIYIFDEPTLGLDILSADAIVSFMKEQKKLGKTVLYSTHYLEEAQFLCDRIFMIYKGRFVEMGTPEELLTKYDVASLRDVFHIVMEQQNMSDEHHQQ